MVYLDANKDGVFDRGDSGIAGVTVTLAGPDGMRVATTDRSGRYEFADVISGTYTITETPPAGYVRGATTSGSLNNGTVNGVAITGVVVGANALVGYNFGDMTPRTTGGHPICDTISDRIRRVESLWTCGTSRAVGHGICGTGAATEVRNAQSFFTCGTSTAIGHGICGAGSTESHTTCTAGVPAKASTLTSGHAGHSAF